MNSENLNTKRKQTVETETNTNKKIKQEQSEYKAIIEQQELSDTEIDSPTNDKFKETNIQQELRLQTEQSENKNYNKEESTEPVIVLTEKEENLLKIHQRGLVDGVFPIYFVKSKPYVNETNNNNNKESFNQSLIVGVAFERKADATWIKKVDLNTYEAMDIEDSKICESLFEEL